MIAVGDELLYGSTVDTNGSWLGERFAELGIPLDRRIVVGDDDDAIATALTTVAGADVVVVCGGLGPTPDDHTREAVAAYIGRELVPDPAVLEGLHERFRRFGYTTLPKDNAKQALVPEGATVLANGHGSAPGLQIEHGDTMLFLLPGVPVEMKGMFVSAVVPAVRRGLGPRLRRVVHRLVHTSGIAESVLSERVSERIPEERGPVSIAYLPKLIGVTVRLTATGCASEEEAARWLDRVEAAIAPAWDGYRFDAETGDLVEALGRSLRTRGATLAVAESCTGGMVMERLTALPGASEFLRGGVVAYDNEIKERVLGVPAETLRSEGAVSEAVAKAMALGVCDALGADTGIAVTGVAGPGGGSEEKPVGTVWVAVAVDGAVTARRRTYPGDRTGVRIRSAQAALNLLYRTLTGGAR